VTTPENQTLDEKHHALVQSQVRTLRIQLHAAERRLFDIEMAQHIGAERADQHADELRDIKRTLSSVVDSLDGMVTP
jgi:hypothetical protein